MKLFAAVAEPALRKELEEGHSFEDIHSQYVELIERNFPTQREAVLTALGLAGRRRLMDENGGCVGAEAAARLYAPDRAYGAPAIRKAAREGRVFAVRQTGTEWQFPVWQFTPDGGVWKGLQEVLAELRQSPDTTDAGLLAFFANHHPLLDGHTPIEALKAGHAEQVVRAARSEQY